MIRLRKNVGTCWNEMRKATQQIKQIISFKEKIQKVLAEEERLKRCRHKMKQYGQIRTFQNNNILPANRGNMYEVIPTDEKETKKFCSKISDRREYNKKLNG